MTPAAKRSRSAWPPGPDSAFWPALSGLVLVVVCLAFRVEASAVAAILTAYVAANTAKRVARRSIASSKAAPKKAPPK